MKDDYEEYPFWSMEAFKRGLLEKLDEIFYSVRGLSEDDIDRVREAVSFYIERHYPIEDSGTKKIDIQDYEEKIEKTKEEIKYLKKLRKRKEKLQEKEIKRYKLLRDLYKEGMLDESLEDEYWELRDRYRESKENR
ncbi:MAG: hypothetical protein ACOYVK_16525 [Bacillota bacterium]